MNSWPSKPLKQLVEINYGDSLPEKRRVFRGSVPVFGSNGVVGRHDKAITHAPVIIIGRKGSIGAVNFSIKPCWPIDTAYYIDQFPKALSPHWAFLFLQTQDLALVKQDGPKAGIRRDDIYEIEIPVPPLVEQRRIVARVEALTSRSQKLRELNASLIEDMNRVLGEQYSRITENAPTKQFSDVTNLVRRWVKPTPDEKYPETGIRSFGKGTFHKPALTGRQIGSKRICRIKEGDLLFMNVFAWEGAVAVAQPEDDGRVASYRFMTHEVSPDQATAEFLCYHFLTERGLEQIQGASPGSAGRNRTLGITKLEKLPVPVPPIEDQRRFTKLRQRQFALLRLQREVEVALASFTPALLAKAFRGEL